MENIDQLLRHHDLHHKQIEILSALKNSIKMEKVEMDEDEIPIGASKLGGNPDLPDEMQFPSYEKGLLTFMGQFNLSEIKPFDQDNLLPDSGILYLFYDAFEQPWGFEEDEGCFRVLYFDGDQNQLKRRNYPETTDDFYPLMAFKLQFKNMLTISENPRSFVLDDDDQEKFWNFRTELIRSVDENGNEIPSHYLLGEPFNVQNDVFEELYKDGGEPVLLFQIDSDEEDLGVMWGDCGTLYFCIQRDELSKKQFDKVKFTLQCF